MYVEGGFEGITKSNCRKAFRLFLEKSIPPGSFQVIASGDRHKAYDDFCTALTQHTDDYVILLVDSEEPVLRPPWEHLALRVGDGWRCPTDASEEQAHLMVQVMESWFLADVDAVAEYYGQHFHRASLPRNSDIEQVGKSVVYSSLDSATKRTQKGSYHKTKHGFDLLERIDPKRVRAASRHAERLLTVLQRETAGL